MGRKPSVKQDVVVKTPEVSKQNDNFEKDLDKKRKAEEARAEASRLDTEKANKDILIKNAKELHQHIVDARATLQQVNREIENKTAALKHVDDEIKAQNYALSRQRDKFEKENAEQIRMINVRQSEVDSADQQYKVLLAEVTGLKKTLQNDLKAIEDERKAHKAELGRLNRHVHDVEAEASKLKSDLEQREVKLKEEKEVLEAEKASLIPELNKISEIKNENNLLWQEIEAAKANVERERSLMEGYKAKLDADLASGKEQLARHEQALKNEEGKLRKWSQDLSDFDLELKAREAEANKALKRYQLNKVVEENREK